ncbi:MucBP domain-containing protein [Periweissella ghanensis]|uniref:MucBP domain-containing protein n=1 Tax=Periweissella ghanensis TaxID=467997 RepID=A0ABM8ZB44_9LACO|nr:MucBP domain-containing protein [Periweissella ghanensis]MCM0601139.1 MucBP domain-containing protein [Periweissella ghanensis]CAH0417935.1 hypothetical protein WGH24286_00351 [Periweissella ghanensis]
MEQKRYFKMYKSGKQWVIASVAFTGTIVLMGVSTTAHADTPTASNIAPTTQITKVSSTATSTDTHDTTNNAPTQSTAPSPTNNAPTQSTAPSPTSSAATQSAASTVTSGTPASSAAPVQASPAPASVAASTASTQVTAPAKVADAKDVKVLTKSPAPVAKAKPVLKAATDTPVQPTDDPNAPSKDTPIHLSNMYVELNNKYAAYNGTANFHLRLYSEEASYYLGRMYIVLPNGVTVAGTDDADRMANFKQALADYVTSAKIHGNLALSQLADTNTGRKVYQITPTEGTYITNIGDFDKSYLNLIIATPTRDSGINQIVMNANTDADAANDVLYVGAGDGTVKFNAGSSYHQFSAASVGIQGADQYLRGIVYPGIQRTMTMFEPKVRDTFNLVAADEPNTIIDTKTHTDRSFEPYSLGFIKNWDVLSKDSSVDLSTLLMDGQPIPASAILTTTDAFTNNPDKILIGHTYTISYKRFAQPVTVNYVDGAGNKIADADSIDTKLHVGDVYTLPTPKEIPGYVLRATDNTKQVTLTKNGSDPINVTYVYDKIGQPVTVKYQDATGKQIAAPVTLNGNVGDKYTTEQKTFAGYDFQKVTGNANGTFSDDAQTVTYVYAKVAQPVTVHYQDENGKTLATDISFTGHVGDTYAAEQKNIPDFNFVKVIGQPTGMLGDDAQSVTFVYQRATTVVAGKPVTVHYQDAQGNTIAPDVVLNGNIDAAYTTNEQLIAGYKFLKVVGSPTGQFTDAAQTVTYIYQKNASDNVKPTPKPNPLPKPTPKPVIHVVTPKPVVNPLPVNNTTTPINHQATTLPKTDQQNGAKLTIIGLIGLLVAGFSWLALKLKHKRD